MSERSITIWKLLVWFTLFSLIAGGFKLFPMNKKYQNILAKSSRLKFGTDKALEDVIEYLEKRLEERSYYQFTLDKQHTAVLSSLVGKVISEQRLLCFISSPSFFCSSGNASLQLLILII